MKQRKQFIMQNEGIPEWTLPGKDVGVRQERQLPEKHVLLHLQLQIAHDLLDTGQMGMAIEQMQKLTILPPEMGLHWHSQRLFYTGIGTILQSFSGQSPSDRQTLPPQFAQIVWLLIICPNDLQPQFLRWETSISIVLRQIVNFQPDEETAEKL